MRKSLFSDFDSDRVDGSLQASDDEVVLVMYSVEINAERGSLKLHSTHQLIFVKDLNRVGTCQADCDKIVLRSLGEGSCETI